jgi:hypothetical protein
MLGSPGIGMEIIRIYPDPLADLDSHESEALRRQTVCATRITASSPLNPLEINPVEHRQSVQSTAERNTAAGRGALRMIISRV